MGINELSKNIDEIQAFILQRKRISLLPETSFFKPRHCILELQLRQLPVGKPIFVP